MSDSENESPALNESGPAHDEPVLPEQDSAFMNIEDVRPHNFTSDSIVDDSFSSIYTSTPAEKGLSSPRPSTRSQARGASTSTRRTLGSPLTASPGVCTRSQSRDASPLPATPSPTRRRSTRTTPQPYSSPRPTRSQKRVASPRPPSPSRASVSRCTRSTSSVAGSGSSPRPATRSQTRGSSPRPPSPRRATGSRPTRTASPQPGSSPRPTTQRQSRGAASPRAASPRRACPSAPRSSRSGITPLPQRQPAAEARFPTKLKCPMCPALLANEKTLATHKRRHAFKRAFTRAATQQEFLEALPELMNKALDKILEGPCIGTLAKSVNNFTQIVKNTCNNLDEDHQLLFDFLGEKYYSILSDHSSIFSSTLQFTFLVGVNKLVTSHEFRNKLCSLILGLDLSEPPSGLEVVNVFLSDFVVELGYCVLIYYVKKIHGFNATQEVRKKRSKDSLNSVDFLQLCYHIGGRVVAAYLFKGEKYKSSSWKSFVSVLRYKFKRVQSVGNVCADEVRQFTEAQDRGGLTHISQEALDFFVVLFDLLMSLEGADGSLPLNVIEDYVLKDDVILCLWDILVGSEVDEEVSLEFLEMVANSCKMTVLKGIMKRKINSGLKKAIASIPMRSRLG